MKKWRDGHQPGGTWHATISLSSAAGVDEHQLMMVMDFLPREQRAGLPRRLASSRDNRKDGPQIVPQRIQHLHLVKVSFLRE
ncbi:hypothetical protein RB195_000197 [Necator americanus]|uniref:Uncharacterized protein n=1 Tax=Necator americanus TaxID=51031 RepID=A0ABR1D8G6_NECAM